jgi:predicted glycosyltransferase
VTPAAERRAWIDLANTPHVLVFGPIVERLRHDGWEVVLTARDHAQTVELAKERWPEVVVIGGQSPRGRWQKAAATGRRAAGLVRFARRVAPNVALSHGSYAQVIAARAARVPAVTMMDYEHQPANHVSFRLASRVIVPDVFPEEALRRFGAAPEKVVRYEGFKEELYLAGFRPDDHIRAELGVGDDAVLVVLRTPPDGALYHQGLKGRFDELLELAAGSPDVVTVLLPRDREQAARYAGSPGVVIPSRALDAPSLLASADVVIGAGGTMTRESAVLGMPTYTVFAGRLAAVDGELLRLGRLQDLRAPGTTPRFEKRPATAAPLPPEHADEILRVISSTVADVAA